MSFRCFQTALVLTLIGVSALPVCSAPVSKVSGMIHVHREMKRKPDTLAKAAHTTALIRQGVNAKQLDAEDCALYVDAPLSKKDIAALAAKGIVVYPSQYVPPVPGKHPHGFYLATVPYDSLPAVEKDARIVRLASTEFASEPMNDLGGVMINVDDVHSGTGVTARDGSGIKIAVADSGVDLTHADLPTPVEVFDMTDGTDPGSWGTNVANTASDHGTHVSGSAVGSGTLSGGTYVGGGPGASFYFYKIGNDTTASASAADEIEAINRARDVGCDIFSMSYGGLNLFMDGGGSVAQAIDSATSSSGMVCFISAGNEADDGEHDSVSVAPGATSPVFSFTVDNSGSASPYTSTEWFYVMWRDDVPGDANITLTNVNAGAGESMSMAFSGTSVRSTESRAYALTPNVAAGASKTYQFQLNNAAGAGTTPLVHCYSASGIGTFDSADSGYTVSQPAIADSAIAVAAWTQRKTWTDFNGSSWQFSAYTVGTLAPFSSRGPRIDGVQKPDIAAPGATTISLRDSVPGLSATALFTIDNDGLNQNGSGPADYYIKSGTSMACPMAAGAASLILEVNPTLSAAQVKSALIATAANAGAPDAQSGYGLIDILAAVQHHQTFDLVVTSPYGTTSPAIGTNVFASGFSVTALALNSPLSFEDAEKQVTMVSTGWVGSGSVPASGSATNTGAFTITEDSAIAWLWGIKDIVLSNLTVDAAANVNARDTVTARDQVTVGATGVVNITAGQEIRLKPNFKAREGSEFRARIEQP